MKASELRIGNLLDVNDVVYKVIAIDLDGIIVDATIDFEHLMEMDRNDLSKPIPLTEEWLLKFGFEKSGINRTKWSKWKIDLVEDEKGIYSFDLGRIYNDIESVHQLQNLYFALTNEELTYEQQK